jgi:hypothetical protein
MRVVSFNDPDGHTLELAHRVGSNDPVNLDVGKATDAERTAQRTPARQPT